MKNLKKLIAVSAAAVMTCSLAAPAMAAAEAAPVITGIVMSEASANYVDSSLYSQYESVEFSDGTVQTIDPEEQTFVLVKDGAIVDLDDPENWTEDAELFAIDKGQFDTVEMSMNTANWGPFYFTAAVTFEDGKYVEEKSVPAAVQGSEITDEGINGGVINTNADYISGIYVYSEDGDHTQIDDVTLNASGLGGNDFGTKGGWGTVISVAGTAEADIENVIVNTEGPLHDGIWAGGSSVVNVRDSVISAKEASEDYDFEPYSYDRFIITDEPLSDEEIEEYGISGDYYAEDYEDMFGAGTHYYYENENYSSNFSAPMLQCVPLALGLYGSMRGCICYGSATLSFYDSLAVSDIWAVLSTDSGNGTLNATDTVAIIGELTDDEEQANCQVNIGGTDYLIDAFDSTESSGYVTYCDGFDDNFYGCTFLAPDYIAILTGGTFDFTESEKQRGYGASDRIGFMSHGNAYTATLSHSDFEVSDALFSVMSKGAVDITLDDVQVNIFGQNPWSGVLFQFMDTDDTGTGANDMEMDVLDLTYDEYQTIESAADGTTKTVRIANSELFGDIYNSVGSSNNTHVSEMYDGTTGILSDWNASLVNVTLDSAVLDGVISTSYAQHVDEEGEPIEGLFYFNKTGEAMEGSDENSYDYHAGRRVMNTPAYNGLAQINLTLEGESTWNVTGTSILNSLTIEEGSSVYGTVTENEDGTITVEPAKEALEAGVYGTVSELHYVEPEGSEGGSGEGEAAEGQEPAGESPEGESAEGESAEGQAAPEGESAEGQEELEKWDAYLAYLDACVELDPDFELYDQLKSEIATANQEDYHGMQDGTMYGALEHSYGAVSFEEFEIGQELPDISSAQGIG